jgi:hypothetical protein
MLIVFFDIMGIVHKEFVLAGLTFNSACCSTLYGDCVKMCEDFSSNFGEKRNGCCIMITHRRTLALSPGMAAPVPEIMDGSSYNVTISARWPIA